jgi:thioredoxin reductase
MTRPQSSFFDVVIIGGGPAGLSASLMLGRACRRVVLIDVGNPRNAAAQQLHGFLGHDGIGPQDLLFKGRKEVERYDVQLVSGEAMEASRLLRSPDQPFDTAFSIKTRDGSQYLGRKLLLATGMRDELPDLPGLRECYGSTIHHCPYCDGWEHRGKPILVYAQDTKKAVGLALAVRGWTDNVTLMTNGLPPEPLEIERLKKNGISWNGERIARLVNEGDRLQGAELASKTVLVAAAMFIGTRQLPTCDLARSLGVERKAPFVGQTSPKQQTNVRGLFIAGDADGDVEFAMVAAAEGATAAVAINRELQDEDRAVPEIPGLDVGQADAS